MSVDITTSRRRKTVPVNVGGVVIGGAAPIPVQTMSKTQTEDVRGTLAQIERAAKAGADIIRVTCDTREAANALQDIVRDSPIPIVADIHYDAPLALLALEAGVQCLRRARRPLSGAPGVDRGRTCGLWQREIRHGHRDPAGGGHRRHDPGVARG